MTNNVVPLRESVGMTSAELLSAIADRVEDQGGIWTALTVEQLGEDFSTLFAISSKGTVFEAIAIVLRTLGFTGDYLTVGEVVDRLEIHTYTCPCGNVASGDEAKFGIIAGMGGPHSGPTVDAKMLASRMRELIGLLPPRTTDR